MSTDITTDATKAVDAADKAVEDHSVTNIVNAGEAGKTLEADLAPLIAPALKETKAGWKTTEFWLSVASSILIALGTIPTPHDGKGFAVAGIVALYAIARGLSKAGVPTVDADAVAAAPAVDEPAPQ